MAYHWTVLISPLVGLVGLFLGHRLGLQRARARDYNEVITPLRKTLISMIESGDVLVRLHLEKEDTRLQASLRRRDWKRLEPSVAACINVATEVGYTDECGQPLATDTDRLRLQQTLKILLDKAEIR